MAEEKSPANAKEPAAALRPTAREWKRLSMSRHLIYHATGMLILGAAYLWLHYGLNARYRTDVKPLVRDSVRLYQVAEDEETHTYALFYEGKRVDQAALRATDLGLGKLPSVRGVIQEVQQTIARANNLLSAEIGAIGTAFGPYEEKRPPSAIHSLSATFFDPGIDAQWFLLVKSSTTPANIQRNLAGRRELDALVQSGRVCDLLRRRHETALVEVASTGKTEFTADGVNLAPSIARIRESVASARTPLGLYCDKKLHARVSNAYDERMDRLDRDLTSFFEKIRVGKEGSSEAGEEASENGTWAEWTSCFHERLVRIVGDELGFFWIFGNWRWVEIVLLTMLGVMVEALVRFGVFLVGRTQTQGAIWDPNETWRSVLKLLYAPITSVIAIWTLISTDVLQISVANTAAGTFMVTLAFLFGLFPNLAVALFKRLAEAIFQSTTVASGLVQTQSKTKLVPSSPGVDLGSRPDFEEFKKAVRRYATAPLRD